MKREYHIRKREAGPAEVPDAGRYRDFGRLMYQYEGMVKPLYRKPLYRDRKAFLVILLIVLLAFLLAEL